MLADWRSNLAALASYVASPADEALIVRLGDSLWEKQGQASLSLCPQILMHFPQCIMPFFHASTKRGGGFSRFAVCKIRSVIIKKV